VIIKRDVILDDYGITEKYAASWDQVTRVDYYSAGFKRQFLFYYDIIEHMDYIPIHSLQENYKKSLEYAVKKLPPSRFSPDARKKLEKMGVRPPQGW
jgi:hypothetical protein